MSEGHSAGGYHLDGYAEVVHRLVGEFADQHTYDAITAAVMKTNAELRRTARKNTTHTLLNHARHRLRQLPPTRGS